jgi:hypothetical protein
MELKIMPIIKKYEFRNLRDRNKSKVNMRQEIKQEILFGPGASGNKLAFWLASFLIFGAGCLFVYLNYILSKIGLI